MDLMRELADKYETLSIVGMSKNAGKTTALNYFIEEAYDEDVVLGITSTGRDGESEDVVTLTEKPRIYLYEDTIVSIPMQLFDAADAGLEILWKSKYTTPMGELLICKVQDAGYVQIAGAMSTAGSKELCEEMMKHGCNLILIDGAIDRKSIASPETSDAIIMATGAVLSRNMQIVVEETAHVVSLYGLPELEEGEARDLIVEHAHEDKIMLVKNGEIEILDLITGLGSSKFIDEAIDDNTEYVYIPGALTASVIADINVKKFKKVTFVLKDPTKIFISLRDWKQLAKRKFNLKVLENIEVACVTVNPWAPSGYTFEHEALLSAMQEALPDIPVIDVKI